jgi:hypothetical protein
MCCCRLRIRADWGKRLSPSLKGRGRVYLDQAFVLMPMGGGRTLPTHRPRANDTG